MTVQLPLNLGRAPKGEVRSQFSALIYRIHQGKVQFLLITTRRTKRWIAPKGWPMGNMRPADAAAQEAWEEAGVKGKTSDQCLGVYTYVKRQDRAPNLMVAVMVYPMKAKTLHDKFPEAGQRRRKWFNRKKAAKLVHEPELAKIILTFDPRNLRH
ncbi:NUDIX hydrolase [Cognatishimia sp. SS12]|uniref:NUDIX hydrolase n=1 Tax=Cognatishimia sp. SS12 TaxID=2979465 RepID=UPI002330FB70|nr:NUDIX hydrolase [Cognatishimia sp. SS12]MDC0736919.1 NUDIX hydrolase [Cognatishimia sp. SS12]